jgi:myosin-1
MCTLGWWLAKTAAGEGWAPSAYLKEEAPPAPVIRPTPPPPPAAPPRVNGANGAAARAKPAPPAPPAKRPAAGRKPALPTAPRDSGLSMNGGNGSGTDSGRNTPTPSLAGGLAEALRARQNAMQKGRDDEDDW